MLTDDRSYVRGSYGVHSSLCTSIRKLRVPESDSLQLIGSTGRPDKEHQTAPYMRILDLAYYANVTRIRLLLGFNDLDQVKGVEIAMPMADLGAGRGNRSFAAEQR